ncbi:hypothetical protein [Streptococcus timonensis]|uniref:hypothetical protein n=1 Tax=Streptococcus timonensis TaxID=1852387 RepID=UPI00094E6A89|nr:hypothetical protein [Streptococcus timonensis]
MWNKLKDFFGLNEILADEPIKELKQENDNLVNVRTLQIELRKCKEEIRQKNDLLNELSTENIKLAQGLKNCSEIIYDQEKLIKVFQDIYNNGGK